MVKIFWSFYYSKGLEMVKVIFFEGRSLWSLLTLVFTGSRIYHVGFYSDSSGYVYDMNVMRRRVKLSQFSKDKYYMFPTPVVENYLKGAVLDRKETYGVLDYLLFAVRWLGFKVKNRKGIICSEMVNNDLRRFGVRTPFAPDSAPPSPADLYNWYKNNE